MMCQLVAHDRLRSTVHSRVSGGYKHWEEQAGEATILWDIFLKQFVGRTLSRSEDALHAIAGVAQALAKFFSTFHACIGPKYLVGLWNCPTLPMQLLWEPCQYTAPFGSLGAPTWSWARMCNIVRTYADWPDCEDLYDIGLVVDIISCWCDLVLEDAFCGAVNSGRLTIEGPMLERSAHDLRGETTARFDNKDDQEPCGPLHFLEFFSEVVHTAVLPLKSELECCDPKGPNRHVPRDLVLVHVDGASTSVLVQSIPPVMEAKR
jgi:hypothetical protein